MTGVEKFKHSLNTILGESDVIINGERPWDPQIRDNRVFEEIMQKGYLAVGESFVDGMWDVESLDALVARVHRNDDRWESLFSAGLFWHWLKGKIWNRQKKSRAFDVGEQHYDLGNDLYSVMLDARMTYTCAYWKNANTLDSAQEAKLDLICRKLNLQPGQHILDIGCGWGSFMRFAVERYGVRCAGLTVSKEQAKMGREMCKGLPIEFIIQDYREYAPAEPFDHIVSIEMFEAVGHKNFREYMRRAHEWLKPGGLFLLQTITSTAKRQVSDPWIDKYIFPNGILPHKRQVEASARGLFDVIDLHEIGKNYDPTLMAWWRNFSENYSSLDHARYNKTFYRVWKYYLLSCAGGFRSGVWNDWQMLMMRVEDEDKIKYNKIR